MNMLTRVIYGNYISDAMMALESVMAMPAAGGGNGSMMKLHLIYNL